MKSDWKEIDGVVSLLTKRQQRRDKNVVNDVKPSVRQSYDKSSTSLPKIDNSIVDELVTGIWDLKIKLGKLHGKGQSLEESMK